MLTRTKARLFEAIARLAYHHSWLVLAVSAVATMISILLMLQLEMVNDITEYLPQRSPVVRAFKKAIEHFGTSDQLLIVIEGEGEKDSEIREALADSMAERLLESGKILSVEYRITDELYSFYRDTFLRHGLLYLDPEERENLLVLLSDEAIARQMAENRELLLSPLSTLAGELVHWDPLDVRSLFLDRLTRGRGQLKISYEDGYFFSEDLTLLVLLVRPDTTAKDIRYTRQLVADVQRFEAEARAELEAEGFEGLEDVDVLYSGGYLIALEYNRLIQKDMIWNLVVAFLGVMALFVISFRRVGALFYVGAPLLMSLTWNFALVRLTYGHLNMFTAISAAVLVGLGIDFAIHIMNRFLAERELGHDVETALRVTLVETGDAAVIACGTTMLAFYAGMLTDFKGLQQLGFIAGTGLALALIANFFVLPAFLALYGRATSHRSKELTGFGLEPLASFVGRHPWSILAVSAVVTVLCGLAAAQTRIDADLSRFRPVDSEPFRVQRMLVERIGSTFNATMILAHAPDEASALDRAERIVRELDRFVERGLVASSVSVSSILPAPSRQRSNLEWLQDVRRKDPSALDADRVVRTARAEMERQGFNVAAFETSFDRIRDFLGVSEMLTLKQMEQTAIGPYSRRFLSRAEEGEVYVATYAYSALAAGKKRRGIDAILDARFRGLGEGVQVVSNTILAAEFKKLIGKDALLITVVTLLVILLFLYFQFRSFRLMILTALPLVLGICWALGVMNLAGYSFNLLTVCLLPVIMGIGIDDGIYIVNRYRSLGDRDVVHAFHDTGRAVVTTSLTTMVGFGSMALAGYPGLVGAGVFAFIGIGACLITAITVLPALMELFGRDLIEAKSLRLPGMTGVSAADDQRGQGGL